MKLYNLKLDLFVVTMGSIWQVNLPKAGQTGGPILSGSVDVSEQEP